MNYKGTGIRLGQMLGVGLKRKKRQPEKREEVEGEGRRGRPSIENMVLEAGLIKKKQV